ncbi:hypothetical protein [Streptomyces sp. NPDC002853]
MMPAASPQSRPGPPGAGARTVAGLGPLPYLSEILPESGDASARWAGLLCVAPTVFGALGAPLRGHRLIGPPAPLLTGAATAPAALAAATLPAQFRRSPRIRWSR